MRVYKEIRHRFTADVDRLPAGPQLDADWDAAPLCDGSSERAVFVFRHHGYHDQQHLKLRELDTSQRYVVLDRGSGRQRAVSGQALTAVGLQVELKPNSAKLFTCRRVE